MDKRSDLLNNFIIVPAMTHNIGEILILKAWDSSNWTSSLFELLNTNSVSNKDPAENRLIFKEI